MENTSPWQAFTAACSEILTKEQMDKLWQWVQRSVSSSGPPSFDELTDFLSTDQISKTTKYLLDLRLLKGDGMSPMVQTRPVRAKLFEQVLQKICEQDIEEKERKGLIDKLIFNAGSYTEERLADDLAQFLGKKKLEQVKKELVAVGFWDYQAQSKKESELPAYKSDRTQLQNYIEDFLRIPSLQEGCEQSVERQLTKCLIYAFIQKVPALETDQKPFNIRLKDQQFIEEVKKLSASIEGESRKTKKITKYLEQLLLPGNQQKKASAYDLLLTIKRELIPIDVPDLCRLVEKTKQTQKEISGKDIILFIGDTGSGKTTTIKALLGYKMGVERHKGIRYITIVEPVLDEKVMLMDSNPECKSVSRYVMAVRPKENMTTKEIYLTDTPGIGDTGGIEVQISNSLAISTALRHCRSVVPVVVISQESWGLRGEGFRTLARSLAVLFHSYETCMESVVVLLNRFSPEEMKDLPSKLENLLETTQSADVIDQNYVDMLEHFKQLSLSSKLHNLDILNCDMKGFLNEVLLAKQPLNDPMNLFKLNQHSGGIVRQYCTEVQKRVDFHLKNDNLELVEFFVNEVNQFYLATGDPLLEQRGDTLTKQLQDTVRKRFSDFVGEFNSKAFTTMLRSEDCESYHRFAHKMQQNRAQQNLKIISWVEQARSNMKFVVESIVSMLTKCERDESHQKKNQMLLENLKLLVKFAHNYEEGGFSGIYNAAKTSFFERASSVKDEYIQQLEASNFHEALKLYQAACRDVAYGRTLMNDEDKGMTLLQEQLENALVLYTSKLVQTEQAILSSEVPNMSELARMDAILSKLERHRDLVECHQQAPAQTIRAQVSQFNRLLREFVQSISTNLTEIIIKAKTMPIDRTAAIRFSSMLEVAQEANKISGISDFAEGQYLKVRGCLEGCIETKCEIVKQLIENLRDSTQSIIEKPVEVAASVLFLKEFKDNTRNEEIASTITILFQQAVKSIKEYSIEVARINRDAVSEVNFECSRNQEIFDSFYGIYSIRKVLQIFQQNGVQTETDSLQHILLGMEWSVMEKLRTSPGLIEEALKREVNDFHQVERILKFVGILAAQFPSDQIRQYAGTTGKTCDKILLTLRDELFSRVTDFSQKYYGKQILEEYVFTLKKQASEEKCEKLLIDIRDRYTTIWLQFRKSFKKILLISNDCVVLASALTRDKETITKRVEKEIASLEDILSGQQSFLKQENSQQRIEILCAITSRLVDANSTQEDKVFARLAELGRSFTNQLLKLSKSLIKELRILLPNKLFSDVKKLLDENKERPELFELVLKYQKKYEQEKEKSTRSLIEQQEEGSQGSVFENVMECSKEVKEMQEFEHISASIKSDSLAQCHTRLIKYVQTVKVLFSKQIAGVLQKNQLVEAYKLTEEFVKIEEFFPSGSTSEHNSSVDFCKEITERIQEEKHRCSKQFEQRDLKHFFKLFQSIDAEIKLPSEELNQLRQLWTGMMKKRYQSQLEKYSKSTKASESEKSKKGIQKLLEYFPPEIDKERYKQRFRQAQQNLKVQKQREEKQAEDEITRLPLTAAKLSFEDIKEAFNRVSTVKKGGLGCNFEISLRKMCKLRKERFRAWKRPPTDYNNFLISEVNPFLAQIRKNHDLKQTCKIIEDDCEAAYRTRLDDICREVSKQLILPRSTQLNEVHKGKEAYKKVCDTCHDLYKAGVAAGKSDELKRLKEQIWKAYEDVSHSIEDFYLQTEKALHIERLFDGSYYEQPFREILVIHALQECKTIIESQRNLPNNTSEDPSWNIGKDYLNKCQQLRRRMNDTIDFVMKFDIKDRAYANIDEVTITEKLKLFKNGVFSMESYPSSYQLLTGSSMSLRNCEEKLKADIGQVGQLALSQLTATNDFRASTLLEMNDCILKLTIYNKIYLDQSNIAAKVIDKLEEIIANREIRGHQNIMESKKVFEQNDEEIGKLGSAQTKELNILDQSLRLREQKRKQEASKKMVNDFQGQDKETWDIKKRALYDSIEKEFTVEKLNCSKQIRSKYRPQQEAIQQKTVESFNQIAQTLILFKMMEMILKASYDRCKSILESFMQAIEKCGRQYCNLLAKALDSTGNNYAIQLIKEHKVFDSYNVKLFKHQIQNSGVSYVVDNLTYQNKSKLNSKASLAFQQEKEQIRVLYQQYQKMYTEFTHTYRLQSTENTINNLKDAIKSKTLEVKRDYGLGSKPKGHQLLALIFALWTISKSTNHLKEGVEYLYDPHPAQVVAIFTTLGFTSNGKLGNRLTQILTGEGKSVVMAGMACYLALIGYEVSCVCYSKLLSSRDHNDFKELFKHLSIQQYVIYATIQQSSERLLDSKAFNLRDKVESVILNRSPYRGSRFNENIGRKKIMLIDEVDVFFSDEYFGRLYNPVITLASESISNLADFVWFHENDNINYKKIVKSQEFIDCINQYPQIVQLLKYQATQMFEGIKNYKHDYIIHEGKLAYVNVEGVCHTKVSWKLTFAYYYEVEQGTIKVRPQDYASINISCGRISYAELPTHYEYIMGVSGTLKNIPECQSRVLSSWYKISDFYYVPSVYGQSRRQNKGARLTRGREHFSTIAEAIGMTLKKNQPVLVFFEDFEEMNRFYVSKEFTPYYKQAQVLSERNDDHQIKNRVNLATCSSHVTLLTKAFGRGIDFVVVDKSVKEAGGVHVIQTFISPEESESLQIEGRTGRQGEKGTFELIANYRDLEAIGLRGRQVEEKDPMKIYEIIRANQRSYFSQSYKMQVKQAEECKQDHQEAMKILSLVEQGDKMGVREAIDAVNRVQLPKVKKYKRYYRRTNRQ